MPKISNLERIDITELFGNEAKHFTPWLANEGLPKLAETLGLPLQGGDTEVTVGRYRADIVARNTVDETEVIIENQFGESNHKHLGQILTYTAGIKPRTVVWVSESFTDEHIDAIDYLNKITKKRFSFFGVTVAFYRICGSPAAGQFQVICKPRNWTKETQRVTNDRKVLQLRYWTKFYDYAKDKNTSLKLRNPIADNYLLCSRRDRVDIYAYHKLPNKEIGVALHLRGDTELREMLHEIREEIEQEILEALYWDNPKQIYLDKRESDPRDETLWDEQHEWLLDKLELFDKVFRPIIRSLNTTENADTESDP